MNAWKGYPPQIDPYATGTERWELLRPSNNDQRIFRKRNDADWALYLADHSGITPDNTDDGPLLLIPPDEIGGALDWKTFRFSLRVRRERYERARNKWADAYGSVTFGIGVATWLAAFYEVPLKLHVVGEKEWYHVTPCNKPNVPKRTARPERRINL
jgi:hypothetical protein